MLEQLGVLGIGGIKGKKLIEMINIARTGQFKTFTDQQQSLAVVLKIKLVI